MVDHRTALIHPGRLPYWFLEKLRQLDIKTIDAHPLEGGFAVNCLTIAPGRGLISDDVPRTRERLELHGIATIAIPYAENHKNGGGIHCSTMPLIRDVD
jgi:N-dimethylarginine dimethylaminohydrolase